MDKKIEEGSNDLRYLLSITSSQHNTLHCTPSRSLTEDHKFARDCLFTNITDLFEGLNLNVVTRPMRKALICSSKWTTSGNILRDSKQWEVLPCLTAYCIRNWESIGGSAFCNPGF